MRAKRNNGRLRGGRSKGLKPGKVFRHGDPALFAPDPEPAPALPLNLTRRQRIAYENPIYPEDGPGRWEGWAVDHTPDPRFRMTRLFIEESKTETERYGDRKVRKKYQLVSTLTIDLESGPTGPQPVWHVSVLWVVNKDNPSTGEPADEIWPIPSWRKWMDDWAGVTVNELVPGGDWRARPHHVELGFGKQSLHYRAPLTPEEDAVLRALMKPRILSAPAGVVARLQAERGEVPGRWIH